MTPPELEAEFRRRGALLLPSGAIVTALGRNTEDFRHRVYRWLMTKETTWAALTT